MSCFGNRDEPMPPESYHPTLPQWLRLVAWYQRNPLHDFTHYVVGWKGKNYTVERSRADSDNDGFADGGGLMVCTLRNAGRTRSYASYQSARLEVYVGWRPSSRALGARFTIRSA